MDLGREKIEEIKDSKSNCDETLSFVADSSNIRIDAWLAQRVGAKISRSQLKILIEDKMISVDGQSVTAKFKPKDGQQILIRLPKPIPLVAQPENIPLDIIFEDEDIIVVNKAAGMVTHPAPGHYSGTLVNAILSHCETLKEFSDVMRPGIVHRLDKDTTGIIVVAKNCKAMNSLTEQFANSKTTKIYLALVHGAPPREEGSVETTIGRHETDRKRMKANAKNGKIASSQYKIETRFKTTTLLRVKINTGRTHQIRVHCAYMGCPIVGDQVYGKSTLDKKISLCPQRQMLHSTEFSCFHPSSLKRMTFNADPPDDFLSLLARLEK